MSKLTLKQIAERLDQLIAEFKTNPQSDLIAYIRSTMKQYQRLWIDQHAKADVESAEVQI